MEPHTQCYTRMTLLYVEDDPVTRDNLCTIILNKFPEVDLHCAENGRDGLELFKKHRPDIVLTDLKMPVLDGIGMAGEIRVMNSNAKIIVITGYGDTHSLMDAIKIGISSYVLKPIDCNQLFEAIEDCIARVTMERQIEEQNAIIRNQQEIFRAVIEGTSDAIYIKDLNGRYLFFNRAAAAFTGSNAEEVIGHDDTFIFPSHDAKMIMNADRGVMDAGKTTTYEETVTSLAGEQLTFLSTKGPLFDSNGRVFGLFGIARDITERKRAEEDKRQLEQQLRQSQKMEAIGTLAGGIAHDFNNILTAITGYCTLIEMKTAKDNPARSYVKRILASAERAASLTQGLLAYSRKQPIKICPLELNELIKKIHHLLSRLLGEDIELRMLPANNAITVMADRLQVEQVLMNLASNARDAMPHGGTLQIKAEQRDMGSDFIRAHGYGKPGRYALLTVADTGSGMDEETRERLFEPFFTTKETGKGTGLGLSIVYGIVKQHDGFINVSSEPGEGTTFAIYLPLTDLDESDDPTMKFIKPKRGSEAILLVEDEKEIRETLREMLENEGYTIIEAVDGEDGIKKFREHQEVINLLILDVIMPNKNGRAVYEEIQAICPGVNAIYISGYTAEILNERGILQEDVNLISKPIVFNELLVKIRSIMDK